MTDILGDTMDPVAVAPIDHATTLEHMAREYLFQFGWAIRVSGRALHLVLDDDQALVLVPTHWASAVLDRLTLHHLYCPALRIPGQAWGFLVTCDSATATRPMPGGTRVVAPGATAPLPPTLTEYGEVTWAQPPMPGTGLEVTVADVATAVEWTIDRLPAARLGREQPTLHRLMPLW